MTLRLGTSPTSPGVVCRWRPGRGEYVTLWRGDDPIGAVRRDGGLWDARTFADQEPATCWPHRHQAKRAVEQAASEWLRAEEQRSAAQRFVDSVSRGATTDEVIADLAALYPEASR